jgi:predicted nucleic acid-binding protein
VTPILDASVFIAAISPSERHHRHARLLFDSHPDSAQFLVPDLFRVEVIAGLARRGEPTELLDTVDALVRGPRFYACPLDEDLLGEAVRVARLARLRAYDAVYVALALARGEPLFTLDGEVASRCQVSFPDLRVFGVS